MNILITGCSGFVGSHLCRHLLARGHQVTGIARHGPPEKDRPARFHFIPADTTRPGAWQAELSRAEAVINLAGRSIFGRWTEAIKKEIHDSRVLTTRNIVEALPAGKPVVLVSASGVGYYGDGGEAPLTEEAPAGDDFLARLSIDWEAAAMRAADAGARVALTRLGVVLGPGGGAMAPMLTAFKSFVGGPIGSGRQWFPWIHIEDLAAAFEFIIETPGLSGPVNLCAPSPVRNRDLAQALGKALNRPAVVPTPAFMLRLVLGEFAGVLLGSQRALPRKLEAHGFRFHYPDIPSAVTAVVAAG
jgi:uncharacterized protein